MTDRDVFMLELDNDIMSAQLSGIKQDMKRWVAAIGVDDDRNVEPIRDENLMIDKLNAFLELHGICVVELKVLQNRKHYDNETISFEGRVVLPPKR